jgi:hypothetical protein
MDQILTIFRKDGRKHWPEILASLILLAAYAHLNAHPWQRSPSVFLFGSYWSLQSTVTPVLILFWIFMVFRVLQTETLVGDRQWWVTKPYDWWKLLAAKLLFVLVVILIPVFFVHVYILHGANFPIIRNLEESLVSELALCLVVIVPVFALGALSSGFGQALLGLVASFFGIYAIFWATESAPSGDLANFAYTSQSIQTFLIFAAMIVAVVLQFARRRTWWSRALILIAFVLIVLVARFTPYAKDLEQVFPLAQNAPVSISIRQPTESIGRQISWLDKGDISLEIPAKVSGVNNNSVVLVEEIKLILKTPDGKNWTRGWFSQLKEIWPQDERVSLSYRMKREDYEKFKGSTVQIQIELALWELREQDPAEFVATGYPSRNSRLGICRIDSLSATLDCLAPYRNPALMATFDPKQAQCYVSNEAYAGPELNPVHAWLPPSEGDFPAPMISPLDNYFIRFNPTKSWMPNEDESGRSTSITLCPGTKIRLATPKDTWRGRLKFHLDNVAFDNLVAGSLSD